MKKHLILLGLLAVIAACGSSQPTLPIGDEPACLAGGDCPTPPAEEPADSGTSGVAPSYPSGGGGGGSPSSSISGPCTTVQTPSHITITCGVDVIVDHDLSYTQFFTPILQYAGSGTLPDYNFIQGQYTVVVESPTRKYVVVAVQFNGDGGAGTDPLQLVLPIVSKTPSEVKQATGATVNGVVAHNLEVDIDDGAGVATIIDATTDLPLLGDDQNNTNRSVNLVFSYYID